MMKSLIKVIYSSSIYKCSMRFHLEREGKHSVVVKHGNGLFTRGNYHYGFLEDFNYKTLFYIAVENKSPKHSFRICLRNLE